MTGDTAGVRGGHGLRSLGLAAQPPTYEALLDWWTYLREEQPVHYDEELGNWHVFRHEDVAAALADHRTFSSDMRDLIEQPEAFSKVAQGAFLGFDPPEHDVLRSLVSKVFTPRMIQELEERITGISDGLLDALGGARHVGFVERYAYPLPLTVIADILQIPVVDRARFRAWSDALFFQGRDGEPVLVATAEMLRSIDPLIAEMNAYFLDVIRSRRARPGPDLISRLATVEEGGQRLRDEEILGVCGFLLVAGHITTTMLLTSSVLLLHEHPRAAAALRADPSLTAGAVEEVMRHRGQLPAAARRTTREVVLRGRRLPKDSVVLLWLAAANRDPRVFPDPARFDIRRTPNRHLALGKGIHYCLGAPLARLELRVALAGLLRRWRHFTPGGEVTYEDPRHTIGAREIPLEVEWAAGGAG
ncbi:cytochrome P450 [Streptomyces sp. NPDC059009]|uniref:cytochrome P450 n=1 Tax=Streptomyces sp. NPDC059009 TaxID=3346694 RepID=UPI00368D52FB